MAATLMLVSAGSASAATTWHVDASGGGTCTPADPNCTTITAAESAASDGDTIDVAAGAYTESVTTSKRLAFKGAGTQIFVGSATVLTGTSGGPALKLTNGGSVSDMIVRPSAVAGTDASFKRALDFEPAAAGPALSYTVANVVATSSGAPSGSAVGNALDLEAGNRPVSLQVTSSRLVGHANGNFKEYAVFLDGANASARLDGVTVDAADEYGALDSQAQSLTIERSSAAGANNTTLTLSQGTIAHSRITGSLYTMLVAGSGTTTVRDSLIRADATVGGARAIGLVGTGAGETLDFRGSTVAVRGPSPDAAMEVNAATGDANAHAVDSAFRAIPTDTTLAPDVKAFESGSNDAVFQASYSYYDAAIGSSGTTVPPAGTGTNVDGDPGFTDPAHGDYTLAPASPLIDRGSTAEASPGERDLATKPRSLDGNGDCVAVPDIGAFERPAVTPCHPKRVPDTIAPVVSRVRFTPHRLRAGRRGRLSLRLSERARVTVLVQRRRHGKFRGFGKLVRQAAGPGPITLRIGPKVKGTKLRRGRYRIKLAAVDAAGNHSKARRVGFVVVRARRHG